MYTIIGIKVYLPELMNFHIYYFSIFSYHFTLYINVTQRNRNENWYCIQFMLGKTNFPFDCKLYNINHYRVQLYAINLSQSCLLKNYILHQKIYKLVRKYTCMYIRKLLLKLIFDYAWDLTNNYIKKNF
jgi:hypothetical protein